MSRPHPTRPPAFRRLERALLRRRLAQLDPRLRVELAALALLIAGFLFWQVRVPLDGLVRERGPAAALGVIAAAWLALAALGVARTASDHARRLRRGPAGPEWLALPIAPAALARHLAWAAGTRVAWLAVPALGVLVAAVGLVPWWWLPPLAIAGAAALRLAAVAGAALGERAARRRAPGPPGHHPIETLLAAAAPRTAVRRLAPPVWRAGPAWLALAAKDLRLSRRVASLRRTAALPLALGAASLLAWRLPGEPALRHFAAFALALLAAAALAEWLIALAGSDPFPTLRSLPVGAPEVWGARAVWAPAAALAVVAGHGLAAHGVDAQARLLFLGWTAAVTAAIALLGVHYGVTLFPRADVARRMLGLSLGLAMAASVMLPLSGWIVLLTAVLHSARRLPRWARLEEV